MAILFMPIYILRTFQTRIELHPRKIFVNNTKWFLRQHRSTSRANSISTHSISKYLQCVSNCSRNRSRLYHTNIKSTCYSKDADRYYMETYTIYSRLKTHPATKREMICDICKTVNQPKSVVLQRTIHDDAQPTGLTKDNLQDVFTFRSNTVPL